MLDESNEQIHFCRYQLPCYHNHGIWTLCYMVFPLLFYPYSLRCLVVTPLICSMFFLSLPGSVWNMAELPVVWRYSYREVFCDWPFDNSFRIILCCSLEPEVTRLTCRMRLPALVNLNGSLAHSSLAPGFVSPWYYACPLLSPSMLPFLVGGLAVRLVRVSLNPPHVCSWRA